jgi:hypothetical protein
MLKMRWYGRHDCRGLLDWKRLDLGYSTIVEGIANKGIIFHSKQLIQFGIVPDSFLVLEPLTG